MGHAPGALHEGTLTVGALGGMPLHVHGSALIALPFFAWFAETRMRVPVALATLDGRWPLVGSWGWAALLTLGAVVALVLHQGAHVVAGRLCGGQVRGVTLVLLGGCTRVHGLATPARRALVNAAGPATSIACGLLANLAALHLTPRHVDARYGLLLLGEMQLGLGALEFLPAPPLDGGRLLLAALERKIGRARGLEQVARFARLVAAALALFGTFTTSPLLLGVAAIVWAGAERTSSGRLADERLRSITIRAALGEKPWPLFSVDAGATVEELCALMRFARARRVIVTRDLQPIAVVGAEDVARIPLWQRARIPVAALGRPTPTIDPDSSLGHARSLLRACRQRALPVMEHGILVALLSDETIGCAADLHALDR